MVDGEAWTWTGELEVGGRMDPKIYLRNLGRNQETASVKVGKRWILSKRGHSRARRTGMEGALWGEGGDSEGNWRRRGRMDPKIYPGNPGRNQETVVERWTVSKRGHGGPKWGGGGGGGRGELEVEEGDGEVLESTWELQTGIGTSRG